MSLAWDVQTFTTLGVDGLNVCGCAHRHTHTGSGWVSRLGQCRAEEWEEQRPEGRVSMRMLGVTCLPELAQILGLLTSSGHETGVQGAGTPLTYGLQVR